MNQPLGQYVGFGVVRGTAREARIDAARMTVQMVRYFYQGADQTSFNVLIQIGRVDHYSRALGRDAALHVVVLPRPDLMVLPPGSLAVFGVSTPARAWASDTLVLTIDALVVDFIRREGWGPGQVRIERRTFKDPQGFFSHRVAIRDGAAITMPGAPRPCE